MDGSPSLRAARGGATSKLAAACQHLAFSELVLYRRGSWYYLDEASTIALFDGLRADLEKLSLASYFAEMAEAVTSEDLPSGEVLSLLLNSLYALDTLDRPNELVRAAFELRLLALSGYEPLLDDCAMCGRADPVEPVFDAAQGVVLCKTCAGPAGGLPLDAGALAAMRHIVGAPSKRLLSFTLRACRPTSALERGLRDLCRRADRPALQNARLLQIHKIDIGNHHDRTV